VQTAGSFAVHRLSDIVSDMEHRLEGLCVALGLVPFGAISAVRSAEISPVRSTRAMCGLPSFVEKRICSNQARLYSRRSWPLPRRYASPQVGRSAVALRIALSCCSLVTVSLARAFSAAARRLVHYVTEGSGAAVDSADGDRTGRPGRSAGAVAQHGRWPDRVH
jgi:hypothetical protein